MLDFFKEITTIALVIPAVLILGLIISNQLRWPQVRYLKDSWAILKASSQANGDRLSTKSAVAAVLGGNLGTGNIAGMAIALSMGGPGALFWMWIMALTAAIFKFCECYLAVHYAQKDPQFRFVGGPMYYMQCVLASRPLAIVYSLCLLCAAYSVGNFVQVQSLSLPLAKLGIPEIAVGLFMALLMAIVMTGGLKRFNQTVSTVVPFMALLYIGVCCFILFKSRSMIPHALGEIISNAFSFSQMGQGFLGFGIFRAMQVGFDRGLFATDAGSGLAAIVHAPVRDRYAHHCSAISQAIASLISPLIVMTICLLTGLVLMVSGINICEHESTNMCVAAFERALSLGGSGQIVTITLFFFSFTTILTWAYCAEQTVQYLFGKKFIPLQRTLFIALIPLGAVMTAKTIWQFADISMNFMLLTNIFAIFMLRKNVRNGSKSLRDTPYKT